MDSLKTFLAGSGRGIPRLLPHVVVFGAGKGGVGTSTLVGLAGLHIARGGASVLLVDADENAGTQHLLFDLRPPVTGLGALRGGTVAPEELLVQVEPGLTILPGGGGTADTTLASAAAERRVLLRRVASLYDRFDIVLVDGGSRLDSVMAACAAGSGRLVAVASPHRIAEAATFALLKVARGRFDRLPTEVVVNRASEAEGREVHHVIDAAASTFLEAGVEFSGTVPADPTLEQHVAGGGSLTDTPESTPAFAAAATISEILLAATRRNRMPHNPVIPFPSVARAEGR